MLFVLKTPAAYPDTPYIARATPDVSLAEESSWEQISHEQLAVWYAQLRASGWQPAAPSPAVPETYRVSKDTIMSRIADHGDDKIVALDDLLLTQPRAQQILWRDYAWFHNDNPNVVALVSAIGLDPAEILARDPFIP